jgi:hypothetical protein
MRTNAWIWIAALALTACGSSDGGRAADDGTGLAEGGDDGDDGSDVNDTQQPSGADADADATAGDDDDDDDGIADDSGVKFDLGVLPDAPDNVGGCGGGDGDLQYSYIWVANSSQNTVSKINTQTLVEEGRYYTRPDGLGSPSRTSVNLTGDVAVANRSGGLTKYYADPMKCVDANGSGGIETSNGAANILPWDGEECRAWHTPFGYSSQRPVAWTQGEWNAAMCTYVNQKVWTTGVLGGQIQVVLVDGDTGVVEDDVMVPEVPPGGFGFYGGAVDAEGNFWASQLSSGYLIRVMLDDITDYSIWPMQYGGYGMTVGKSGYVFTCSWQVGRFDPMTETWSGNTVNGGGGCMEDDNGILWMASSPLVGVDVQTLNPVYSWPIPEYVHGVSIDFDGHVWGVSMSTSAYKVDPQTGTFDTVTGLVGPYTYSDMTGFALSSVGGGGAPTG